MPGADMPGGEAQSGPLAHASGEGLRMALVEFSLAHAVPAEQMVEWVVEAVLEPIGSTRDEWRFTELHFHHAGIAGRLQRNLGINVAGVALALQLLEELQDMRQRLESMKWRLP